MRKWHPRTLLDLPRCGPCVSSLCRHLTQPGRATDLQTVFTCHETGPGTATSLLFSRTRAAQIGWRWSRAQARRWFPAPWANTSRLSAGVLEKPSASANPVSSSQALRWAQRCRIRALPSLLPSPSTISAASALGGCWVCEGSSPPGNAACLCGAALLDSVSPTWPSSGIWTAKVSSITPTLQSPQQLCKITSSAWSEQMFPATAVCCHICRALGGEGKALQGLWLS